MRINKFILTRDVSPEECSWLDRTYKQGQQVFEFMGATYGCCTDEGIACSLDGNIPFFELPRDALVSIYSQLSLPLE